MIGDIRYSTFVYDVVMSTLSSDSLALHSSFPPGKLAMVATKPLRTQRDLSLAYSPGVAAPVLKIAENPRDAYAYTNRGNVVAVISNGSAILGLGNRGALASKPVMEGKAVLFKRFAGIDAFDLEIESSNIDDIVRTVTLLEPSFGGVNLEDIKAPECFIIERRLIAEMKIPVFHDDQHGTAIVASAGLLNALDVAKKNVKNISIVINGAGAAGIAIARMLGVIGVERAQITLCDSHGVIGDHRTDLNEWKAPFAKKTSKRTLADAVEHADVFIGVSKAGCLTPEMLQTMQERPIVFAMANPDPEIDPVLAKETRSDVLIATGRSDFPNQINNILCFPFLFRAALDTRATMINDAMKMSACTALAELAKEPVPSDVLQTYGLTKLSFGPEYLLPKPFDARLLTVISSAVAKASMESGVATETIDLTRYPDLLQKRMS